MRRKSTAATAKQAKGKNPYISPLPTPAGRKVASPPSVDPLAFLSGSGSSKKGRKSSVSPAVPTSVNPASSPKSLGTVADLRNFVASQTESLKRQLDMYHEDIVNEFDSSESRISKRFKIQTQQCQQLTEEIDKEYKKMSDRIVENSERIKSSYMEFMAEAQASSARVCKVGLSELAQSTEKTINDLRAKYKIPTAI
ncbi:hypothetical protein LUZ60_014195 [Juncus effusus]|nr:hypothetical protein LUZ60_014195 [Juncus effusus]